MYDVKLANEDSTPGNRDLHKENMGFGITQRGFAQAGNMLYGTTNQI